MTTVTKRIHFLTDDPSPTIRCRIFGHKWADGTAFTGHDDHRGVKATVCRRCKILRDRGWDGITSFRLDGGP